MPRIRIPLKPTDPDAVLDLQALLQRAYATGPYPDRLNYRSEPLPALASDDMNWAEQLLKQQGFRG